MIEGVVIRKQKKSEWQQKIAKERIEILFNAAEKEFKKTPERTKRYIELARKIGLRYNLRLSKSLKRNFCKNCNSLLKPGVNAKIKLDSKTKTIVVKCLNCGRTYRHPY
ncbi:MAG: ribonuclease P [Candidatus Aenigmarchaeota archaeon]|nr:ribonuclease P [Candidatus Aenigmarchaeota archaeon]